MRIPTHSHRFTRLAALCAFTCQLTSCVAANCQQTIADPAAPGTAPPPMVFDKVMMYPDTRGDSGGGFLWWDRISDNAFFFGNVSSLNLIADAYGLGMHQVIGLPAWAEIDRYGLSGNMGEDEFEEFEKLPVEEQVRQQRLMTQAVLAARYRLQTHRETREMPVYELILANGGLKIAGTDRFDAHRGSSFFMPGEWLNYGTMEDLASQLAGPTGAIVIDKTGLGNRRFQYHLKWSGDESNGGADRRASISTALEQQLGLKLVTATDPVEVLVVDHIEKPTMGPWQRSASGSSK